VLAVYRRFQTVLQKIAQHHFQNLSGTLVAGCIFHAMKF